MSILAVSAYVTQA